MKIFAILVLLAFFSCRSDMPKEAETPAPAEGTVMLTEAEMKTAGIVLGRTEVGESGNYLRVNGVVEAPPQHIVSISFPMGGYLASTRLLPGMRVKRGEVIAEMQDQAIIQLQQDYLIARSRSNFLRKELDRQTRLNVTKTTSDKVLEQTQSEYEAQTILMNSLREKLMLIRINVTNLTANNIRRSALIYSPIDGYVSHVYVNVGKYVSPSDVMFELVNPSNTHLVLKVFEKDLALLQYGQAVTANLVSDTAKTFQARIRLINKNLDADRSAGVHCDFVNANKELLPGMFMNAVIRTSSRRSTNLPEEAVVRWNNRHYVFVQQMPGTFHMTEVRTGSTHNGVTVIDWSETDLDNKTLITGNAYTALMKLHNKAEE